MDMKEELLEKIKNQAVKNELSELFNNGVEIDEDELENFAKKNVESRLLQIFPTMETEKALEHLDIDLHQAENIFMIMTAHEGLYWKVTELVKSVSERSDAKIVWNFQPSRDVGNVMKIVALSC